MKAGPKRASGAVKERHDPRANNARSARQIEPQRQFDAGTFNKGFYTGRYIVVFRAHTTAEAVSTMRANSGLRVASSSDFTDHSSVAPGTIGSALYLESLGIAIADASVDQLHKMGNSVASGLDIVPERVMFVAGSMPLEQDYLEGYRAGVNALVDDLLKRSAGKPFANGTSQVASASDEFTWGLVRSGVSRSSQTGKGVRLAILDTGYDQSHPDLLARVALSKSFVPNSPVQDVFGHGTHCLGIAAGIAKPISSGPRYGCAGETELLVGKVLGDNGSGDEGWLLNGLNWALENGADVVSLSIEGPYDPASPVLPQYEAIGRRALDSGRLILAAAGNYSVRPLLTRPVASPACASTIMGVGAIGPDDKVASFSCSGGSAASVDLAAPGVSIESSFPMPRTRKVDSGTSMAAPLAAGIAALHMEATSGLQGQALWDKLLATASALPDGPSDIGAGCVAAP